MNPKTNNPDHCILEKECKTISCLHTQHYRCLSDNRGTTEILEDHKLEKEMGETTDYLKKSGKVKTIMGSHA